MSLPDEIQYIIISFVSPIILNSYVCKAWNIEIKNIKKKSASIISNWYYKKKIPADWKNMVDMIRCYVVRYPDNYFIQYPEWTVNRLNLNPSLLETLPNFSGPNKNRKRSDVRDWLLNLPISLNEWKI
jgi:hypothetical protein